MSQGTTLGDRVVDAGCMRQVAALMASRSGDFVDALTEIATHRSAEDEVDRSIRALAGACWEVEQHRPGRIGRAMVFHPSNNVLYSYVLYAVVPSLFCESILLRPSSRASRPVERIHELVTGEVPLPVTVVQASHRRFLANLAGADLVVFTGSLEHALGVAGEARPDQLFLFFGSGVNPVVIGPEADLDRAAHDVMRARLYNSGQDCLCPDVLFVADVVCQPFLDALRRRLASVRLAADRAEPGVEVAPIVYDDVTPRIATYFRRWRDRIVVGGGADAERRWIEPTVLLSELGDHPEEVELFAPVFNVVRYRHAADVERWLRSDAVVARAMYLCVYGQPGLDLASLEPPYAVCRGEIPLDVEVGNRPFGGHGPNAGFAQLGGVRVGCPLLISAQVGRRRRHLAAG